MGSAELGGALASSLELRGAWWFHKIKKGLLSTSRVLLRIVTRRLSTNSALRWSSGELVGAS